MMARAQLETVVLEVKENHETYLVSPELWQELLSEVTPKILYTTINRQNILTAWPIRLPGEDGRLVSQGLSKEKDLDDVL